MSSSESTATPSRPTSPSARGESESTPISVGMSNAHDSPVCPCSSRYRNRSFVSSAVPNPANCRIVHRRPAIHRRVHAARERERARIAEIPLVVHLAVSGVANGSTAAPEIDENTSPSRIGAPS